jgi:Tfp pilus assembly protein PilO
VTQTRKIVLGAVGAVLALFALWFFLLWGPQGGKLVDAQEREDAAATTNAELVLRRDRLAAAQEEAPALQAKVETLRTAVPDDPQLAQFILAANDAASASGVDFLSISPTPPTASVDPTLPASVNLGITVDGGYFQVLDYLNRLSDLDRIVVVDTLGLAPAGGEDGGPVGLSVSVTARMFTTGTPDGLPGALPAPASPASTEATTTTTAPEATS